MKTNRFTRILAGACVGCLLGWAIGVGFRLVFGL